ncbi:class I SAM-dependent methyltransferase [Porcincola intestinalis]|uniref:Class I SAM-dependent methyltransferase n=1 Tax=Porcincola intestinalis TaxID=2606632 RepID=A0A6L5X3T0_9FIRM|nr:class I SAM-dependent methyltransferase [Porcincola intestinalis]MSS14991.1 class I SAM-dependent methyltransferase [Porcincola intestinalis]
MNTNTENKDITANATVPQADTSEPIDFTYIENARKPVGELGGTVLDDMNESHAALTEWGFAHLHFGSTVLDVGCGGGNALRLAMHQDPGAAFFGIDYSDVSIEKATAFNGEAVMSGRLSLKKASVSSLPFGDGFFDTVYSVESYFFWPDLPNDMREICRVLKSGGTFAIIVEMVAGDMSDRFEKITEHLHMNVLAPEQLAEVYRQAGFTDVTYDWDKEKGWLVMQGRKA